MRQARKDRRLRRGVPPGEGGSLSPSGTNGAPVVAVRVVLLLGTLSAFAACGGDGEEAEGFAIPQPADAVRAFDPDDIDASIDRLNRASFAEPSSVRSLAPFIEDPDPDRRWAAIYLAALLVTDEHAGVLRPALEDPELPLRVTAAGALSGEGVVESIPVLIEALGSDEELWYSDPPRPAADLAREALEAYTGEAFATPEEWEAWWGEVRGSLRWDGERYVEA